MDTYFSRMPTITYDGVITRNITERVVMVTTPRLVPTNYYPYELNNHLRADQVAGGYYNDPNLDWMIYIVNNMVDPYYDWHLYDEDFDAYLIKKYGSIEYSQQLIAFWRHNWYDELNEIPVSQYEALPWQHKGYYEAVADHSNKIKSYKRREEDWTMATNRLEFWNITQGNTALANGDLLVITYETFPQGWAEVVTVNTSVALVKHVIGNTIANSVLYAWANNERTATLNSVTILQESITDEESKFWEPVAWYDFERERNEERRFIQLLDANYALETAEAIRKALINK